jgi:putative ABC transport system ATP-binding protein
MDLYSARALSFSYAFGKRTVPALRDVSLSVRPGELLAVSGPSGSGKTTLLNLLGLLAAPGSGTLAFEGAEVSRLDERARTRLRRERIGFIFQRFHLIPVLTALENVEYFLLRKYSSREARRRALLVLDAVGVAEQAAQRPSAMSGGQLQRVAVARALAKEPSVVLADEPTASLDHATGASVLAVMKRLNKERVTTFIFSTHDPKVLDAADRVLTLEDGALV